LLTTIVWTVAYILYMDVNVVRSHYWDKLNRVEVYTFVVSWPSTILIVSTASIFTILIWKFKEYWNALDGIKPKEVLS
jgi:hypothetical protein